jgi:hypothetical protein
MHARLELFIWKMFPFISKAERLIVGFAKCLLVLDMRNGM